MDHDFTGTISFALIYMQLTSQTLLWNEAVARMNKRCPVSARVI